MLEISIDIQLFNLHIYIDKYIDILTDIFIIAFSKTYPIFIQINA